MARGELELVNNSHTDGRADRQTDGWTDRQTLRKDGQTARQADVRERCAGRQTLRTDG